MEATTEELTEFFGAVLPHLNEVQRRVVAGSMARALGRGGKTAVADAAGMGRNTVAKGMVEVEQGIEPSDRLRAPGGGDRPAVEKQPGLLEALDELVHPETRGTPMSALRWTLKSTYELADELAGRGFKASSELVRVSDGGIPQVVVGGVGVIPQSAVGVIPQGWGGDERRLRVPGVGSLSQ